MLYFASEYHLQGTTFVSFSSFTSTLKLKTHSQLTQSLFTGIDCLFLHFFPTAFKDWAGNVLAHGNHLGLQAVRWLGGVGGGGGAMETT